MPKTIKAKVRYLTENEMVAIMESHGWNDYGIENMLDDIEEPMTYTEFVALLADYEDIDEQEEAWRAAATSTYYNTLSYDW